MVTQSRVLTLAIVPNLQVLIYRGVSLHVGGEHTGHAFGFESAKEAFHDSIVVANARPAHTELGRTPKGSRALCTALTQAAHAATHTKNSYLAAQYHRLAGRRGVKRAIVAVEHSILVIAYQLIQRHEPYQDLGGDYFDKRRPEVTARHMVKQLEQLG